MFTELITFTKGGTNNKLILDALIALLKKAYENGAKVKMQVDDGPIQFPCHKMLHKDDTPYVLAETFDGNSKSGNYILQFITRGRHELCSTDAIWIDDGTVLEQISETKFIFTRKDDFSERKMILYT